MLRLCLVLMLAAPAAAAPEADTAMAAEEIAWVDEHARWNAEHMAAARRLQEVAAALRRHDTRFDRHADALRVHAARTRAVGHDPAQRAAHRRLQAEHLAARRDHDRLMRDVADLEDAVRARVLPAR
jgi:hypothetical protein